MKWLQSIGKFFCQICYMKCLYEKKSNILSKFVVMTSVKWYFREHIIITVLEKNTFFRSLETMKFSISKKKRKKKTNIYTPQVSCNFLMTDSFKTLLILCEKSKKLNKIIHLSPKLRLFLTTMLQLNPSLNCKIELQQLLGGRCSNFSGIL